MKTLLVFALMMPVLSFCNIARAQNPEFVSALMNEILISPLHEQLVHDNSVISQQSGSDFEIRVAFESDRLSKIILHSRRTGRQLSSILFKYGDVGSFVNVPVSIIVGNESISTRYFWQEFQKIIAESNHLFRWNELSGDINSQSNRARIKLSADMLQTKMAPLTAEFSKKLSHLVRTNFSKPEKLEMDRQYESTLEFLKTMSEVKKELLWEDFIQERKHLGKIASRITLVASVGFLFAGANIFLWNWGQLTNDSYVSLSTGLFLATVWASNIVFDLSTKSENIFRKLFGHTLTEIIFNLKHKKLTRERTVEPKLLESLLNQKIGKTTVQISKDYDQLEAKVAMIVPQNANFVKGSALSTYKRVIDQYAGAVPIGSAHITAAEVNNGSYLIHVVTQGSTEHISKGQPARAASYEGEVIRTALRRALRLVLADTNISTIIIPALGTEPGGMMGDYAKNSATIIFEVVNELKEQIRVSHIKKIQIVANEHETFEAYLEVLREKKQNLNQKRYKEEAFGANICINLFR